MVMMLIYIAAIIQPVGLCSDKALALDQMVAQFIKGFSFIF
jgi:hypothetical protein